ncbi:MAG: aminoglycoside phosphotransferase family protein [Chloroflexota bacterium]|nr:aminoglycoside phosphotransferase family protein [Chloroflexota bacterium]
MPPRAAINIEEPAQLLPYLRGRRLIEDDEEPAFHALAGGVSNRAVLVKRKGRESWVIKQALHKLRVEADWFSSPERIHREAAGLRRLGKIISEHVPDLIYEDNENHVLAMTAVPQPHTNWKTLLLSGSIDIDYARSFGSLLARIHNAIEHNSALADEFAERRFFEELRLEPYYGYSAKHVPQAAAFLHQLIDDTRARRFALAHGDYSPKNVLIYRNNLIILDFEVIHFGDPAFDVGFSLTHFLSKAHHLPAHRESFLDLARRHWQTYHDDLSAHLRERVRQYAAKHTLACMLARVAGRSPLEYLDAAERERQQQIVLALIEQDIADVPALIDAFGAELRRIHE